MDTLVLKLVLTPALIGTASLAGRRFGPAVSGWLVGIPFTSAPIAFFLAVGHGAAFAGTAAAGTMAGAASQALFGLGYAWAALRWSSPTCVAAGTAAFALATVVLERAALPLGALLPLVVLALVAAIRAMPKAPAGRARASDEPPDRAGGPAPRPLPAWDIPARMVVATAFVLALTGVAPALGPRLTGLLAPFPLYATVLAAFAHHLQGPGPAVDVLRGLLLGLFSFAGFFFVVAALIERAGIALSFLAAAALALAIQAGALLMLRRSEGGRPRVRAAAGGRGGRRAE